MVVAAPSIHLLEETTDYIVNIKYMCFTRQSLVALGDALHFNLAQTLKYVV